MLLCAEFVYFLFHWMIVYTLCIWCNLLMSKLRLKLVFNNLMLFFFRYFKTFWGEIQTSYFLNISFKILLKLFVISLIEMGMNCKVLYLMKNYVHVSVYNMYFILIVSMKIWNKIWLKLKWICFINLKL